MLSAYGYIKIRTEEKIIFKIMSHFAFASITRSTITKWQF